MTHSRQRILFVHASVNRPCGPDTSLFELIKRLDPNQFHCYLVVPQYTAQVAKFEAFVEQIFFVPEAVPISVTAQRNNALGIVTSQLRALKQCRSLISQHQIDLVHTNIESCWVVGLAARSMGVPAISHIRGLTGLNSRIRSLLVPFLLRLSADRYIAVSPIVAESFARSRIPRSKIDVVNNGVDVDIFSPQNDPSNVRNELQIGDDTPLIGAIGSSDWRKGWAYLALACGILRSRLPELKCLFVGDFGELGAGKEPLYGSSSYAEAVQGLVEALDLEGCVYFLGPRSDVTSVYASLDVVVQPSMIEAGPRTVIEALASGKPVIATDAGGNRNYVRHEVDGLLVPVADSEGIADAVSTILSDSKRLKKMGVCARSMAEEKYSINGHVEQIVAIYRNLLR